MYVYFHSSFIHVDACSSRHLLCETLKQASIENGGHETALNSLLLECWLLPSYFLSLTSDPCKLSFAYLFLHIDLNKEAEVNIIIIHIENTR